MILLEQYTNLLSNQTKSKYFKLIIDITIILFTSG